MSRVGWRTFPFDGNSKAKKMPNTNESNTSVASPANPGSNDPNPYSIPKSSYYTLGLLTVVYSFNFIDRQLLAILQESIKADLALSDSQLGLLTGFAFAVFYVTAGISIARWADQSNRRNIIALAVFIWSFMTAISGVWLRTMSSYCWPGLV
jgi:MFS family permease